MKKTQFLAEILKSEDKALIEKERSLAEELMKLRFRKASGQLTQTHELGRVRRSLATVKTVLRSRKEKKA